MFFVPARAPCPECKGGRIGLDLCETCGGTGTVLRAVGKQFPDTKEGYAAANAEMEAGAVNQTLVDCA